MYESKFYMKKVIENNETRYVFVKFEPIWNNEYSQ